MIKKLSLIFLLGLFGLFTFAQKAEYVGSGKCKACHKKAESGEQYKIWEDSTHAKAFETLKSEKALEVSKKLGLTVAPSENPKCVKCHSTGFGDGGYEIKDEAFWNPDKADKDAVKAAKRMEDLQAVGCESCHGAGSEYKGKKNMTAVFNGELAKDKVGLLTPDEETCKQCHNEESPTFKAFDFKENWEKIKHPYPEGYRK